MKILYVALCDLWANGEIGIINKVFSQLKCMEKVHTTYLISYKNMVLCTYKYTELISKNVILSNESVYQFIERFTEEQNIEIIYLRYLQTNPYLNNFLKNMKHSKKKVVIEFPTIPYELELKGRVELEEDKIYRHKLKKYVSYSTNFNGLKNVFGIASIPIHNGINIEDIPLKIDNSKQKTVFIAVATMNFWHGYDRFIKGLADYYRDNRKPEEVYLKLIGNGKEIPRYKDLVEINHLQKYVSFEGMKSGKELDEEFNEATVALGSIGMSRIGMESASPIKAKEYCARGIPIILGYNDMAFDRETSFLFRVPNDESHIKIEQLLSFSNLQKKNITAKEIRKYAEENLTWDIQFEGLFKQLNW